MLVSKKKFLHVCISLAAILLFFTLNLDLRTSGIFLILVYAYAIYAWLDVTHKPTSLYFVFLLYCALSNAGQTLLYVFQIDYIGIVELYKDYSAEFVTRTLEFESICILMLSLGALIAYRENRRIVLLPEYKTTGLHTSDYIFIMLYCVMLVSYILKVVSRGSLNYGDFFYGDGNSTSVDVRITILFYTFLFNSYWHHYFDRFKKFIYGSSIVLGSLMMIVGSRSLIIPMVFGLIFTRLLIPGRNQKRYTAGQIALFVFIGIVGLYFLQVFKTLRGYSLGTITFSTVADALSNSLLDGLIEIIGEIGGSTRCITETIIQVDSNPGIREHTMLYAVLKMLIPVGVLKAVGISQTMESLTVWVTTVGGGWAGTGAWGYSIIAEAYFDIGQYGWVLMFFFGYIWVILERLLYRLVEKDYHIAAFSLVYFLSYATFLARAELSLVSASGRYCLYIIIASFIIKNLFKRKNC